MGLSKDVSKSFLSWTGDDACDAGDAGDLKLGFLHCLHEK